MNTLESLEVCIGGSESPNRSRDSSLSTLIDFYFSDNEQSETSTDNSRMNCPILNSNYPKSAEMVDCGHSHTNPSNDAQLISIYDKLRSTSVPLQKSEINHSTLMHHCNRSIYTDNHFSDSNESPSDNDDNDADIDDDANADANANDDDLALLRKLESLHRLSNKYIDLSTTPTPSPSPLRSNDNFRYICECGCECELSSASQRYSSAMRYCNHTIPTQMTPPPAIYAPTPSPHSRLSALSTPGVPSEYNDLRLRLDVTSVSSTQYPSASNLPKMERDTSVNSNGGCGGSSCGSIVPPLLVNANSNGSESMDRFFLSPPSSASHRPQNHSLTWNSLVALKNLTPQPLIGGIDVVTGDTPRLSPVSECENGAFVVPPSEDKRRLTLEMPHSDPYPNTHPSNDDDNDNDNDNDDDNRNESNDCIAIQRSTVGQMRIALSRTQSEPQIIADDSTALSKVSSIPSDIGGITLGELCYELSMSCKSLHLPNADECSYRDTAFGFPSPVPSLVNLGSAGSVVSILSPPNSRLALKKRKSAVQKNNNRVVRGEEHKYKHFDFPANDMKCCYLSEIVAEHILELITDP